MKRPFRFLLIAGTAALFAGAAMAQSLEEQLAAELAAEGYTKITISRTLLGRTRIEATGGPNDREREIIFNPRTGLVLRDILYLDVDDDDESEGNGQSQGGREDDGDDDEGDDDDDDDVDDDDDDDDDDEDDEE